MENPWKKFSTISPQRENGNRQISNDVYQAIMKADLTGAEYKICLAVIEKTWGFNKASDAISCVQFIQMTGLSERMVRDTTKRLKERRIIYYEASEKVRVNRGSPLNEFLFNKHHDTWLEKGCTVVHPKGKGALWFTPGVHSSSPLGVHCGSPTKEINTKETIQKKKILPDAPPAFPDRAGNRRTVLTCSTSRRLRPPCRGISLNPPRNHSPPG